MSSRNVRARQLHWKISNCQQLFKVSIGARLLFTWLIPNVDNLGRIEANSFIIKGMIFPLDMNITPEVCEGFMNELNEVGLIIKYQFNDSQYLCLPNFNKYQRLVGGMKAESCYPAPPEEVIKEWESKTKQVYTCMNKYVQVCTEVEVEVEREEEGEEKKQMAVFFDIFWNAYPKKIGKSRAKSIFEAKIKSEQDFADLKVALEKYMGAPRVKGGYIKDCDKWLGEFRDWIDYKDVQTMKEEQYEILNP